MYYYFLGQRRSIGAAFSPCGLPSRLEATGPRRFTLAPFSRQFHRSWHGSGQWLVVWFYHQAYSSLPLHIFLFTVASLQFSLLHLHSSLIHLKSSKLTAIVTGQGLAMGTALTTPGFSPNYFPLPDSFCLCLFSSQTCLWLGEDSPTWREMSLVHCPILSPLPTYCLSLLQAGTGLLSGVCLLSLLGISSDA